MRTSVIYLVPRGLETMFQMIDLKLQQLVCVLLFQERMVHRMALLIALLSRLLVQEMKKMKQERLVRALLLEKIDMMKKD